MYYDKVVSTIARSSQSLSLKKNIANSRKIKFPEK